jgi:hypothetical protein
MFLVGWLVCDFVVRQQLKAMVYLFFYFPTLQIAARNEVTTPPHKSHLGRVLSPTFLLPLMLTFGWLLCHPTERQPPKAERAHHLSIIFVN